MFLQSRKSKRLQLADTALFTIYNNVRAAQYVNPIVIDTEETDNNVQAACI